MIGLDTNVLVRYFAQDDVKQSRLADRLIDSLTDDEPGYVSLVTLIELVWVLKAAYGRGAHEVTEVVSGLLRSGEIQLQESESVRAAISAAPNGELIDALIGQLGMRAGCTTTVTFDRSAGGLPGMRRLTR